MSSHTTGIMPSAGFASAGMGDGWTGMSDYGEPSWKKNNSKIYVVVYPSNETSTEFLADPSRPKVQTEGAGYGIFVEPKKVSKTKFWKEKGGEPTLFTVENGISGSGFIARQGKQWGINGMLIRFLIDSKDDVGRVNEVYQTLSHVAAVMRAGDLRWLREALVALSGSGLIQQFCVEEFIELVKEVVRGQLGVGASWDRVLTVDYEGQIAKNNTTYIK